MRCLQDPVRSPSASAPALGPAPMDPSPPPALRSVRADFPHTALRCDHASRTRNTRLRQLPAMPVARGSGGCCRPASRSRTPPSALPLADAPAGLFTPRRHRTSFRSARPHALMHAMLPDCPPLHSGLPGSRRSRRPSPVRHPSTPEALSSTGITPPLQSYGPLRHPASQACPSGGSGCRVRGTNRASPVATPPLSYVLAPPPRRKRDRCVRRSLPGPSAAFP